uniref:DENN/MADD domain containing 6B n=1 Tax=Hucho hucho TaxID=62062 RepID=A0A4W5NKZ5_9TELE
MRPMAISGARADTQPACDGRGHAGQDPIQKRQTRGKPSETSTKGGFQSFLIHLHMLWELMLLGEPVVIMAPSPTVSSETVLALVSPNVILGNTNPFFIKTFQSWPHIRLGELKMSGDLPKQVKKLAKLKTLDTKAGTLPVQPDASAEVCDSLEDPSSNPSLQSGGVHGDSGARWTSAHLKGDWVGLYRKFFRSPNFDGWSPATQGDDPETRMSPPRGHL